MKPNIALEQNTITELETDKKLSQDQLFILHKLITLKYSFASLWTEIEDNFTSKQVKLIQEKVSLITDSIATDDSFAFISVVSEEQ
jgi:hypothetical protein